MQHSTLTLPVTDVKQRLLELLKKVNLYHEVVTITKNGTPEGVLLSLEDFESLMETIEILGDPHLIESLKRSKKQAKQNKFYSDDEVWS
ncbi:MAG: type II toxin-antitoxin system Phd/YefM family antitoxin [Deltaproteobacteria bacterium]|nr:type II toxin-antitoxin system Phd/YefM family antitoxin [Deltaproteobacteria bacterium]